MNIIETMPHIQYKLSFWGVLRSETLKFSSFISNWVLLVIVLAMGILFNFAVQFTINEPLKKAETQVNEEGLGKFIESDIVPNVYQSVGSLPIGVVAMLLMPLAVLFITNEFTSRAIMPALITVPNRTVFYFVKLLVISLVSFISGVIISVITYLVLLLMIDKRVVAELELPKELIFNFLLVGLVFMLLCWIGYGVGAIVKNSAGGIVAVLFLTFGMYLMLGILSNFFDWAVNIAKYLPTELAQKVISYELITGDTLSEHLASTGILAALSALIVVLGYIRFRTTTVS
ncbi:hypothetical protein KJY77_03020 [Canibacter sp. lx-72]|uniref:ABC transporter permease n=1 Tax=Canibacter zhuwentaonis TaxID=2837491 RepID=UPI001BDDC9C8|nr:ABC transporter permease [Canibacter zhuwentaonis]MBT1018111.1 hypothetical protein [Canibacter zhuwentaonis]MBT1035354.1 hypothetical protein [Canibacter zhuwentaonis]